MKKQFYQKRIFYLFILAMLSFTNNVHASDGYASNVQVIPDEAIRLRILANSNDEKDQEMKRAIRDAVNAEIDEWVKELTSIEAARELLIEKLPVIEQIARTTLTEYGSTDQLQVQFGEVQFPTKLYGDYLYPAGIYEAILITIGEGVGDNWWCVLFPPLCFLDFSTGLAVEAEEEDVKEVESVEEEEEVVVEDVDEEVDEETEKAESVDKSFIVVEWFHRIVDWIIG